jgi:hypothetical protein
MLVFKINPSRTLATVAAITLAASGTGCKTSHQAVGQDNGSLRSNLVIATSYNDSLHTPQRHALAVQDVTSQPVTYDTYPAVSR